MMMSIHRSWNCAKLTSEILFKDSCDVDADELLDIIINTKTTLVFRKCWGASVRVVWRISYLETHL